MSRSAAAPAAVATLSIPLDQLGVTIAAPAPALVSEVNASYLGMTPAGLKDVLRAMRADPAWAERVIVISRKRIVAEPGDVVAFLRARHSAAKTSSSTSPSASAPPAPGDRTLRELGLDPTAPPAPASASRRKRAS